MRSKAPFRGMGLRGRLSVAFAVVAATMLGLSALSYASTESALRLGAQGAQFGVAIDQMEAVEVALPELQASFHDLLTFGGDAPRRRFEASATAISERLARAAAAQSDDPAQAARVARIRQQLDAWRADAAALGPVPGPDASARATAATVVATGRLNQMQQELRDAIRAERRELAAAIGAAVVAAEWTRAAHVGGAAAGLLLAAAVAAVAIRHVLRVVGDIQEAVEAFAAGELTRRIPVRDDDEIGHLALAINRVCEQLAGTLRDLGQQIEQTRAAEAEVRGQLAVTRAVVDSTAEAIVLLGPNHDVLLANPRVEEFYGDLGTQHRGGWSLFARAGELFEDPAPIQAIAAQGLAHPEDDVTALATVRAPRRRELSILGRPVRGPSGEYIGRLFVQRDVTREREVDRMKTEFVGLVSHELRTPLTSIKGYVDLLIAGEAGEVNDEQREFLSIVKTNSDRLVALINDLLDVSRIEAGKIELRLSPVDLATSVEQVATLLRPAIEAKSQSIDLRLPARLPPALGDRDRLAQIMTNLLSNAHKYTPSGGHIEIAASAQGDRLCVSVRDDGIGMTAEELDQLYTRFFRANNPTTDQVGGTGLGLTITKSLVEMHGGEISVDSRPGAGTTFAFTLPVAVGAGVAADEAPPRGGEPRPGARILVVEDEPAIARLIQRYLERAGYAVLAVGSGPEALRAVRASRPDLVILDVLLPGPDGLTVLEWLKGDPATAVVPVLMLSVAPDDGRGRHLGAVGYLSKPVKADTLLAHVARILGSEPSRITALAERSTP